jgi:hypothetical protein
VIATQSDGTVWIGPAHYRIVKPQTLGIADAPTIWQAMTPLVSTPSRGGEGVDAYIHPQGNGYMATVLRELKEGPATADEVLVSFDRAGVGWRPTAAYKREVCRGTPAAQWTTGPCT